jgi:hypothetical protein
MIQMISGYFLNTLTNILTDILVKSIYSKLVYVQLGGCIPIREVTDNRL